MNSRQKGFAHILPLLLVVVLIGAGGYWMWRNDKLNIAVENPTPTPTFSESASEEIPDDWEIYTNEYFGYKVSYPPEWTLSEGNFSTTLSHPNNNNLPANDEPASSDALTVSISLHTDNKVNEKYDNLKEILNSEFIIDDVKGIRGVRFTGVGPEPDNLTEDNLKYYSNTIVVLYNGDLFQFSASPANSIHLKTFDDILSTFEFIDNNSLSPSSDTTTLSNASLVPTSTWKDHNINGQNIKLPPSATIEEGSCTQQGNIEYDSCYLIRNHDENLLSPPHITIKTKTYNGGSRRVSSGLTTSDGSYTYTEKLFSQQKGLEAVFNCQISECTALRHIILVVKGNLIFVTDGTYRISDGSTSIESPVTNTIISTIGQ